MGHAVGYPRPSAQPELGLRRVLCATDVSPSGKAALGEAAMVGRLSAAEVVVVSLNPAPADRDRLAPEVGRLAGLGLPRFRSLVVEGDPSAALLGLARRHAADLIVLGLAERGPHAGSALGPMGHAALEQAPCPVLTVPVPRAPEPTRPWRHVLCPVNFSPAAEASARYAAGLARLSGARLTFLHVLEWFAEGEGGPDTGYFHIPELQLDLEASARQRLRAMLPPVEAEVVVCGGRPATRALRVAREREADLIVLGTHARRAADIVLSSGMVRQVVRGAPCPVVTVRLSGKPEP